MKRASRRQTGWPGRIGAWIVKAVILFIAITVLWVLLYRFVPPPLTMTMAGDMMSGRGVTKDWMSLGSIDRDMVRATIAAEDSKFCAHSGFDQDAIAEAMRRNAKGGRVIRGGSTISQQTAKNAFLWQGGGYFRKGMEAWFTFLIEHLWGKPRIMEVYLNVAETGIGTYGVNAGAQRYFNHDASALSRTEAARIAAILPLPKKRGAVAPQGFTRRYGNSIIGRIGVVARDGLDACVYGKIGGLEQEAPTPRAPARKSQVEAADPPLPQSDPPSTEALPGDEYERSTTDPVAPEESLPPLEVDEAPVEPPGGNEL